MVRAFPLHPKSAFRLFFRRGWAGVCEGITPQICHSKEIDLRDVDGFFICDRVPSLDNAGSLKTVADVLKDHGAEFATSIRST